MIPRSDLPDDASDWSNVPVVLARLEPDTTDGCPCDVEDVVQYLRMESADLDDTEPDRLRFIRSAALGNVRAWIWEYTEADGEVTYITVHLASNGDSTLGVASPNGLTHEQFLLAEHYDAVYWG
jgi:hypothetical protein